MRVALASILAIAFSTAMGAEDSQQPILPTLVSVGTQADQEGGHSTYFSVSQALTNSTWASLSGGLQKSPDDLANLDTRYWDLGLDQTLFDWLTIAVGYQLWGEDGELETRKWYGSLSASRAGWQGGIRAENRDVDIIIRALSGGGIRTAEQSLEVEGVGAFIGHFWTSGHNIRVEHMRFDYSRDPTRLAELLRFRLLTGSVITLANSFLNRSTTLSSTITMRPLAGRIRGMRISGYLALDENAVDRSDAASASLSLGIPIAKRHELELTVGGSDSEDGAYYAGVTWSWERF